MWGSSLVRAGIWRWLELSGGAHLPDSSHSSVPDAHKIIAPITQQYELFISQSHMARLSG